MTPPDGRWRTAFDPFFCGCERKRCRVRHDGPCDNLIAAKGSYFRTASVRYCPPCAHGMGITGYPPDGGNSWAAYAKARRSSDA